MLMRAAENVGTCLQNILFVHNVEMQFNTFVLNVTTNQLNDFISIAFSRLNPYSKKSNLNSDKKRHWLSELKSLNDKTRWDSATIPDDIVANLISEEEIDCHDK